MLNHISSNDNNFYTCKGNDMTEKRTKKDEYNESLYDLRTYINGETCIKPYYYMRNGLLHVRYTVDRCVELTSTEVAKAKIDITLHPEEKQSILAKLWALITKQVGRPIIMDGIAELEKRIKGYKENGQQSKSNNL